MGKAAAGLATLVVLLALAPITLASPAALDTHVVAVPPSVDPARGTIGTRGGYLNAVVVADVEGTLTLTNADITAHDVVSDASGPSYQPWCERYLDRACPLFASPLVGLGGQAQVEGLRELTPATAYTFACSIHPWMTGTLVAI